MERQTQAQGLSRQQSMNAYAKVSEVMRLKSHQRTALDYSPHYSAVLNAAHINDWVGAYILLALAGIVTPENFQGEN